MIHNDHETFIKAIHYKKKVEITWFKENGSLVVRNVVPLDYGPFNNHPTERYHCFNLWPKRHIMGLDASRIDSIKMTQFDFDPKEIIFWEPSWYIQRNW